MKIIKNIITLLTFIVLSYQLFCQEICNNSIDDDGDGLIDLNDITDCSCEGIVYGPNGIIQSLISNPSFEEYYNCPTNYSQMSLAVDWNQATYATSDYYNSNSECNFSGPTASALPYPQGNGIVGMLIAKDYSGPGNHWQEYVGTCLSQPLSPGTEYEISFFIASKVVDADYCDPDFFFDDIDITVFGNDDCIFPVPTLECPTGFASWTAIGSNNYVPQYKWSPITISFTPTIPTTSIMIGGPCNLPNSYIIGDPNCVPYFMLDGLVLAKSSKVNIYIKSNIDLCSNKRILDAYADSAGGTWQWYYDGIAIMGATSSSLDVEIFDEGQGNYTAIYSLPANSSCFGSTYKMGQHDLFHEIPNVITPNNDGINDFIDFGEYMDECDYHAEIFNRWGQLVFSQTTNSPPFTGITNNSQTLSEGVYFYVVRINDFNRSGMITIIK